MPSLVSYLVMGVGGILAVLGVMLVWTVRHSHPHAKNTLIVFDRELQLRAVTIITCIAGCLFIMSPIVYSLVSTGGVKPEHAERHVSQPNMKPDTAEDRPVVIDHYINLEHGETQAAKNDDLFDLSGEWTITNTILESSHTPYTNLRLGFRMLIHQDGSNFQGTGEKSTENGNKISGSARRPLRIHGTIKDGSAISATFQEEGLSRSIQGSFSLTIQDRNQLTGTFASTSANARGASQWTRTSSRQVAQAHGHQQKSQSGPAGSPPAPSADQSDPPVVALVDPVQGQQVTTAQILVSGTATSAQGIVRVDVELADELRAQRTAPGRIILDFSERILLHPGTNDIVVTAFDQQNRSTQQRVTVTHVEERNRPHASMEVPAAR
jgi:hypothetical protein